MFKSYFAPALFVLAVVAGIFLLSACSPTITSHGAFVSPSKRQAVTAGVTTAQELQANWGPPTAVAPFDGKTWYYIGEVDSQQGIFEHEVDKRQMIKVTIDDAGTVTEVADVDPKLAQNVDLVERKTLTAGKEYTAVQQFVGNIGKFNKPGKK
jgi:outer membrane protein assembly factor BamE (lipoprotein component of BamABCDE complex)